MNPANLDQLPDIVDVFARWPAISARLAEVLERTPDREQPVEGLTVGELWDVATMTAALANRLELRLRGPVLCGGCDGRFTPDEIKAHVLACEAHPLARRIRALEAERAIVTQYATAGFAQWEKGAEVEGAYLSKTAGMALASISGMSGLFTDLDAARAAVEAATI